MSHSLPFSLKGPVLATQPRARQSDSQSLGLLQTVLISVLVATSYYAGTLIGFALTPRGQAISTLWPPNAILLAALLLTPRRTWWFLVLTILPIHFLVQLRGGVPLSTAFGFFLGNTGEALLAAACIRPFQRSKALFDSVQGVIVFTIFGVLLAPIAAGFVDAAGVVLTGWGGDYWRLWTERLFTNVLSQLTFVPMIVIFASGGASWFRRAALADYIEAGFLAVGIVLVSLIAFGRQGAPLNGIPALIYLPLPFLLWAAVRFGTGGVSASLFSVAVISIAETMHGRGPFSYASTRENALYLQLFLGTITVPLMLLSAVLTEWRNTEEGLRNTQTRLIDVQEKERSRIARELHDDIGQRLALLQIQLTGLQAASGASLRSRMTRLCDELSETSKVTSELSHTLHPSFVDHVGLETALKTLCHELSHGKSFHVHICKADFQSRITPDASLCLYRIAQEALHNIDRHSRAQNVVVELNTAEDRLILRVCDDGIGFTPGEARFTGLGLTSMRERLRLVGGAVDISSAPGKGTRIEASVPLSEAPPHDLRAAA